MFKKVSWKRFFIATGIVAAVLGASQDEFTPPELLTYYAGTIMIAAPVTLASTKKDAE
jgi:hypothetical protein